ncbi:MAG: crotonase/enoyl-CoA hydratase family protein [Acidimicrobiia bacterium]|nr:crotonase/enoyl-CoA hydratase family protein [Acidimicrobiia bacterium]
MGSHCFEVTESDHIAHIVLNRPDEFNSMTPDFWSELPQLVDEISDRGSARAMVVSSTGKHFSSGMDISVFTDGGLDNDNEVEVGRARSTFRYNVLHLQDTFTAFERARMPVLAAVQGGVVGGAVDMVTACDMRYATADAWFCIQEINIGMTADVGTLQRLPKLIPEGIVRELAYTGDRMSADRAKEVGLVNEVYPDHESLIDGVLEIATRIASRSPLAVHGSKEMINYTRDHSTDDALRYMAAWQTGMFQPTDLMESFGAQMEKRDPVYDDLPEIKRGL